MENTIMTKEIITVSNELEENGIVASFDMSNAQGKLKAINAKNGAGISLKDVPNGEKFTVVDVMQYRETIDTYGQQQEGVVTALFTPEGEVYSSISATVQKVGTDLIELLRDDTIEKVAVKVVKQKSKAGQEFINLSVTAE